MFPKQRIRRLAAGGGVLVLALAGVLGATSAASAEEGYGPVPDQNGTLTVHKHVEDEDSTPGHPAGAPMPGVGFNVKRLGQMVGEDCVAVDLTTPEGWAQVSEAMAAMVPETGAVPGFCTFSSNDETTGELGTFAINPARGLYVVVETTPGDHLITQKAAPFLVTVPLPDPETSTWDFGVDVFPKNVLGTFTPTKTAGATNVDGAVVPEALVPWTINTTVPAASFPYNTIKVTDTPAAGHTFEAWTGVTLNGSALNGPDVEAPAVADYTVVDNVLTLTTAGLVKVNAIVTGSNPANATLAVSLTTRVTSTAQGSFANDADVTLNGTTVPVTPPQTNWGKLVINKHVAGTQTPLGGARFAVYQKTSEGADCVASDVAGTAVWTTPANPNPSAAQQSVVLWISNTAAGAAIGSKDYCLKETQAPTGYVLDPTPRKVTISSTTAAFEYNFPNVRVPEPRLPLTGSTGAMVFGLVGFGLIGAAGVLFATRRSRATAKQQ